MFLHYNNGQEEKLITDILCISIIDGNTPAINVGDGYEYGCYDYSCYRDSEEYQSEFYKAVRLKDKNGKHKIYKRKCKGKRIEYKDLVLYTDDHPYSIMMCTEEKSGVSVGQLIDIDKRYDRIIEALKDIPDVREYPDAPEGDNNA